MEFQYKGETEVSVGDGEGDEDGWLATHMGVDTGGKSAEGTAPSAVLGPCLWRCD